MSTNNTNEKDQNVVAPAVQPATPAPETTAVSVPKKATVTVDRDKFEAVLNRLERLEAAASKAGLHKYDEDHKEKPGTEAGIKTYNGKRIVSYVMTSNTCEKNPNGVWREDQNIELTYEDGTKEVAPYAIWAKNYVLENCVVLSKKVLTQEIDIALFGEAIWELQTKKDGTKLNIGIKYLNG